MAAKQVIPSQAVNIDATLGKARSRIYRLGIELEGGWSTLPDGCRVIRDGSVRFNEEAIYGRNVRHIGEIPSPLLTHGEFPGWMKIYYPPFVNGTCGLHVHMSFKTAFTYQRLMDERYPATVLAYVTRWAQEEKLPVTHPLWGRLAGNSEYCQHLFMADEQVRTTAKDYDHHRPGHRYTSVSYGYGRHGTLECRLLPMFETVEQGTRAVKRVIDITNAFLVATAKREPELKAEHVVSDECLNEVRKISV